MVKCKLHLTKLNRGSLMLKCGLPVSNPDLKPLSVSVLGLGACMLQRVSLFSSCQWHYIYISRHLKAQFPISIAPLPPPPFFSFFCSRQLTKSRITLIQNREGRRQGTLSRRCYRQTWHHSEAQLGQKLPEGL